MIMGSLALLFMTAGCKKQKAALAREGETSAAEVIDLVRSIGGYHNEALDAIAANPDLASNDKSILYPAIHRSTSAVMESYGLSGVRFEPGLAYDPWVENCYELEDNPFRQDTTLTNLIDSISSGVTPKEQDLLREAYAIFRFDASRLTMAEEMDTIIRRAGRLYETFVNGSWQPNTGGAAGGFIAIALHSARWWKNYLTKHPPMFQPQTRCCKIPKWLRWGVAPEADALGYLTAWFKAWAIDEEPEEKKRIREGLYGAAVASGLNVKIKKHEAGRICL